MEERVDAEDAGSMVKIMRILLIHYLVKVKEKVRF
jgi:hypothetical protein